MSYLVPFYRGNGSLKSGVSPHDKWPTMHPGLPSCQNPSLQTHLLPPFCLPFFLTLPFFFPSAPYRSSNYTLGIHHASRNSFFHFLSNSRFYFGLFATSLLSSIWAACRLSCTKWRNSLDNDFRWTRAFHVLVFSTIIFRCRRSLPHAVRSPPILLSCARSSFRTTNWHSQFSFFLHRTAGPIDVLILCRQSCYKCCISCYGKLRFTEEKVSFSRSIYWISRTFCRTFYKPSFGTACYALKPPPGKC